jgi:hypothetical protein
MAPDARTIDPEATAFLELRDAEIGPWTAARAAERGLSLPPAALPGVIDNVALLRGQTGLFVTALGEAAGEIPGTFEP